MNLLDTKFPVNISILSRCVSSALHLMHPLHCSVQQNCDILAISILEANGHSQGKQTQSAEGVLRRMCVDLIKWATNAGTNYLSQKAKGLTEQTSEKKTSRAMFSEVWLRKWITWLGTSQPAMLLIHLPSIANKTTCDRGDFISSN